MSEAKGRKGQKKRAATGHGTAGRKDGKKESGPKPKPGTDKLSKKWLKKGG